MGTVVLENLPFETRQVVGARARIGFVVLSSDYTLEHELRLMPRLPGVDYFHARIPNSPEITPETLAAMGPRLTETAALILPGDKVDVLAYGCTSASVVLGSECVHAHLTKAKPEAQTTNPALAAATALGALNVQRVAVLTPYTQDVNTLVQRNIEAAGFDVPVFGSFNEPLDPVVAAIDTESLGAAIKQLVTAADVDGVFISCTSVRIAHALAALEDEFGLPVISSNTALIWHALRLAGISDRLDGFGRIFTL